MIDSQTDKRTLDSGHVLEYVIIPVHTSRCGFNGLIKGF